MRFVLTRDPDRFAQAASALLESRVELNVLATVLADVLEGLHGASEPRFAYGVDAAGTTRFAALRTAPWFLRVSEIESCDAGPFIERWLEDDPELPGVSGLTPSARAIAGAWTERTARPTRCRMNQAMHALDEVRDPLRPAAGELRHPRSDERDLLVTWMETFAGEAGVLGADQAGVMVDARAARGGLLVWDDGGPVSFVCANRPIAGAVRIGPVYTPPEHRRNGYATSAVAAVSRRALQHGANRCVLFTDLANPTSNRIYFEVGYRRIAGWEEHAFDPHRGAYSTP